MNSPVADSPLPLGFEDAMEPRSRSGLSRLMLWVTTCSIVFSTTYLLFRTMAMIQDPEAGFSCWAMLYLEASLAVPHIFNRLNSLGILKAARLHRKVSQTVGDDLLPCVDVLITYCGEGVDVLMDTLRGALAQEYPSGKLRFAVLDDSISPALAKEITKERHKRNGIRNLHYATRGVDVKSHSKAANLNFGTRHLETLEGNGFDYVAVLDVDMIPEPRWLTTMVRDMQDPEVGLANPNQNFYNIPQSNPTGALHEYRMIDDLLCLQDIAGQSFCTGSGFVVKRKALEQIGGFPEQSLQEDVLTSILLAKAGWRTSRVPGQLQWGLAPDTLSGWIRQRQRWAAGILSLAQYLSSDSGTNIGLQARVSTAIWGILDSMSALNWTVAMISLPLIGLFGNNSIVSQHHLKTVYRLALLDFVGQGAYYTCLISLNDFRSSMVGHVSAIWTAPYRLITVLRFYVLPRLLEHPIPLFKPTGMLLDLGIREHAMRRNGNSCLWLVLFECGGWFHALVLTACLVIPVKTLDATMLSLNSMDFVRCVQMLSGSFFYPPVFFLWIIIVRNVWTPLSYGLAPPPSIRRQNLLVKNKRLGISLPKEEVKRETKQRVSQILWLTALGYYVVALLAIEHCLP